VSLAIIYTRHWQTYHRAEADDYVEVYHLYHRPRRIGTRWTDLSVCGYRPDYDWYAYLVGEWVVKASLRRCGHCWRGESNG
jgi:hypothetical protein